MVVVFRNIDTQEIVFTVKGGAPMAIPRKGEIVHIKGHNYDLAEVHHYLESYSEHHTIYLLLKEIT